MLKRIVSIIVVFAVMCSAVVYINASGKKVALLYLQASESDFILTNACTPRLRWLDDSVDWYLTEIKYYITPNYKYLDSYKESTRAGAASWYVAGDIKFTETTNTKESICDFKCYAESSSADDDFVGIFAYTKLYCGSGPYQSDNQGYYIANEVPDDYWGAEIFMNVTNLAKVNSTVVSIVAAHELGHFLGLGHSALTYRIMYFYGDLCTTTGPRSEEINAVIDLYENRNCLCHNN